MRSSFLMHFWYGSTWCTFACQWSKSIVCPCACDHLPGLSELQASRPVNSQDSVYTSCSAAHFPLGSAPETFDSPSEGWESG